MKWIPKTTREDPKISLGPDVDQLNSRLPKKLLMSFKSGAFFAAIVYRLAGKISSGE
jgi:hypothetical protein